MPEGFPETQEIREVSFDAQAFIHKYDLTEMSQVEFQAHGGTYVLETALGKCDEFAQMVQAMLVGLDVIPESQKELKASIVKKTLGEMILGATQDSPEIAKKK